MNIRVATPKDIESIADLNVEVQNLHAKAHPHIFKHVEDGVFAINYIAEQMTTPNTYFFIAELDGEAVGYVFARVIHRPENPYTYAWNWVYIDQIAVKPSAQGKGCGSALIQAVRELAQEEGIETIALDTWAFNEKAQDFFKNQGFTMFNMKMWMEA